MAQNSYVSVLKTTFLFGFVQIFNIIVKIVQNKIVAILLGPAGMGIIGIFQNALNLLNTGCGLGIPNSAVRDISEANGKGDENRISYIISLVKRIVLYTGLFGLCVCIIFSLPLSLFTFGDYNYTIEYIFLSIAVFCTIVSAGQSAILTGMRQLKSMAQSSMIGCSIGLGSSILMYLLFGAKGIVPSLIISAFSSLLVTRYFLKKIYYQSHILTLNKIRRDSKSMLQMGVALMLVSFVGFAFALIITVIIRYKGSLSDVGVYSAGVSIILGYFGVVINAMTTDYYPRICAINADNKALEIEANRQSEVGLVLVYPLAVFFTLFSKYAIDLLYSAKFYSVIDYTDYAIYGMILIICSNCFGMILLAKQKSKVFLSSVFMQRIVLILFYYLLYSNFGILGLGIGYFLTGILALFVQMCINYYCFKISVSRRICLLMFIILSTIYATQLIRDMSFSFIQIILSVSIVFFSCLFTYKYMSSFMKINLLNYVFKKNKK